MRSIYTYTTLLILIMACIASPALADVKYTGRKSQPEHICIRSE